MVVYLHFLMQFNFLNSFMLALYLDPPSLSVFSTCSFTFCLLILCPFAVEVVLQLVSTLTCFSYFFIQMLIWDCFSILWFHIKQIYFRFYSNKQQIIILHLLDHWVLRYFLVYFDLIQFVFTNTKSIFKSICIIVSWSVVLHCLLNFLNALKISCLIVFFLITL